MIAMGLTQGTAVAKPTTATGEGSRAAAADDPYTQAFLTQYGKIKAAGNGYFSPDGLPYHSAETLMVEAPDHGHETTSEAVSFWMWLEAAYGRVTGDWDPFNEAWAIAERTIIPQHADQSTADAYNPSSPATYAPEWPLPDNYPSALDSSVPVGSDPIATELASSYGTMDVYGMHWLMDLDNTYGYGNKPGTGGESGPGAGPSFINTYQRGAQESVWETIPQPTTDLFNYGGPNGYLDLFVDDASYAKQWKYTNAPDADARAVQAAYWAYRWASAQGKEGEIAASVAKAAKMGDYLRYAMFDKYFKRIGSCTDPNSCPAASGRDAQHYLLSWYYAWGGAAAGSGGGWAWRIGDGASHQGYQNPLAAWALSNVPALTPKSATARTDWAKSLTRQLEFLQWLQSAEGAFAGGCTNSWDGKYGTPPAGTPTFYGMAYDWQPVYHDPPSNNWFGFQVWGMERVAAYYYVTGNATAKAVLSKWVAWASGKTTVGADGSYRFPSTLNWTGEPDTWNPTSPGNNAALHVSVVDYSNDVGVGAAYVKTLTYYAARSGDADAGALAKALLDAMALNADDKGIAVPETRADYNRFDDEVFVPDGWSGEMPGGDTVEPGVTFIGMRSWYRDDPDWPKVQAYLDGGPAPTFTYHRFWAQAALALAFSIYAELLVEGDGGGDTEPPTAPAGLTVTATTNNSVSLSWSASTDNVAVTGYDVYRNGVLAGSTTTRTFTDQGLAAATAYGYAVAARDAGGNTSALSTTVSATTKSGGGGTGSVKVQYKNTDSSATDNQIRLGLQIVNTGSAPIDLSTVKVRYWFSSEAGASTFSTYCDYAALGSSNINHTVVTVSSPKTGADHYLEVGFTGGAGSVAAGASTGEVQLRLNKSDWSNFSEADDYSRATNTGYADAPRVAAYVSSALAWGVEP
ncbi:MULTISPECIES: glycoside hydrolase family 48 protein [unclassified Streptomyces]|uniref:glycoside hydrolase family 48 protein n=1 Tax=unclassified Streptomyces TaxID=2593676 RepID=UPI0029B86044|nr:MULTISPECIES: glycoside hydrolase family 48 protein [unclassified Streptomyces]MDX2727797.1 glycoside hydrolase family 48 protein [Streptomyces sp. PA03-2a]MDX3764260.1 glycoside hydrolase family 48 protein [Streptomyces sp. AK08-01B]MDX3814057.1 glycoside hydrolase family 48 protein [Streptomyces sp. AK08-01A]